MHTILVLVGVVNLLIQKQHLRSEASAELSGSEIFIIDLTYSFMIGVTQLKNSIRKCYVPEHESSEM